MAEATWFVIERGPVRPVPALYYEELPAKYRGKRARENGLIYVERIDEKPHLAGASPRALYALWKKHGGKLPQRSVIESAGYPSL